MESSLQDASELSSTLGSEFDIEVLQLTKGSFSGKLTSWALPGVVVSHGHLERSVQISGVTNRDATLLLSKPDSKGQMVLNGTTLDRRDVLATPYRTEHRFVLPEEFHGIVLQLDHRLLSKTQFPPLQYLAEAHALWEFACAVVKLGGELDEKARESLGARCIELVLQSQPPALADKACTLSCRRRAALQAADLIHEEPQAPLTMGVLCGHTHVGERTLRDGFIDVFGLPPMEYVLTVRLNLVRSRLRGGGPQLTVARAATELGFWHLARFAGFYRGFFGELPSETLRRATALNSAENG